MKVVVLGIGRIDIASSKKSGNPFHATVIHGKCKDANVEGDAVERIPVSDTLELDCMSKLKVGQTVDIEYNNRGYICDVQIVG